MTFNLYGLVLGLAILASFQASLWLAKERKVDPKIVEYLFWWVVAGGIIGARAYHVIDKWREIYSLNPQSAFYIWNGGLAIWGAIVGGVVALFLGIKVAQAKIKWRDVLDVVFFGLPLGQAIGRWGNFFNNEIVGKNGETLFLYESVLDLALFGVLVLLVKLDKLGRGGRVAGMYLVGYGLIRVVLETYRQSGDQWLVGGVSAAAIFSVAAMGVGAFLLRKKS